MIIAVVVVVFSLLFNDVCSQSTGTQTSGDSSVHPSHKDAGQVQSEKYEITVMKDLKEADKWNIDVKGKNHNANVKNILKAIDIWAHMKKAPGSTTFSGSGYQGLKIKHFINGKFLHEFNLAICSINLAQEIVYNTIPNNKQNKGQLIADFKTSVKNRCPVRAKAK